MKKLLINFIVLIVMPCSTMAQYRELPAIRLYSGKAPGTENRRENNEIIIRNGKDTVIYNVETPTITPFLPAHGKSKGMAMVVCPGGGYQLLAFTKEGTRVCRWLAEHGITAFLLKYRTDYMFDSKEEYTQKMKADMELMSGQNGTVDPTKSATALLARKFDQPHDKPTSIDFAADDARSALSYIRRHADEYGIHPSHLGLMGFSAGARITWNVVYNHTLESRPDVIAPIYCSVNQKQLPADPVPFFAAAPQVDIYPDPTAYNLYKLWYDARIPAELHYFANTSHGFGLSWRKSATNIWIKMFYNFLINTGFINDSYLE